MSSFKFYCLHCNQHIEADKEWRGQITNCPNCNQEIVIDDGNLVNKNNYTNSKNKQIIYLNEKPDPLLEDIKKQLNLCRRGLIPNVLLSFDENNYLSVHRDDYYVLTWENNGLAFTSVSTSLTFKKIVMLFEEYFFQHKSLKQLIRWRLISEKCGYPQNLDNLNQCKRPCKLTQKQGELHDEKKLRQQKGNGRKATQMAQKSTPAFFSMDSDNLGCGTVIILFAILGIFVIFKACNSNMHQPSSKNTEENYVEYDKVRRDNDDPIRWRAEEYNSSPKASLDELRRIDDPDQADRYFKENMNVLLREAWEENKRQRSR